MPTARQLDVEGQETADDGAYGGGSTGGTETVHLPFFSWPVRGSDRLPVLLLRSAVPAAVQSLTVGQETAAKLPAPEDGWGATNSEAVHL